MADASRLGKAFAAQGQPVVPASLSVATRLFAALSGRRIWKPVVIPSLGITAVMTLLGTDRELDIEGEVSETMKRRKLGYEFENLTSHELERGKRVLAASVFDDDLEKRDNPTPLGSLEDWGRVTKEEIADLYRTYLDLSAEHDPAAHGIDAEDIAAIEHARQKKSEVALRSFGVRRLASFIASMADQPASSPTPSSSPSDSLLDS